MHKADRYSVSCARSLKQRLRNVVEYHHLIDRLTPDGSRNLVATRGGNGEEQGLQQGHAQVTLRRV